MWWDTAVYPSYSIPYLSLSVYSTLQLLALLFLTVAVCLEAGYKGRDSYSFRTTQVLALTIFAKAFVTILVLIEAQRGNPLNGDLPLEALFVLLIEPAYESKLGLLLSLVPKFGMLMAVFAFFLS